MGDAPNEKYGRHPNVVEPSTIRQRSFLLEPSRASPPNVIIALVFDRIVAPFPRADVYPITVSVGQKEDPRLGIHGHGLAG